MCVCLTQCFRANTSRFSRREVLAYESTKNGNKKVKLILTGALALSFSAVSAFADPHDVFGVFATEDGNSHIQIGDCGDGTPCGTIVWIDRETIDNGMAPEELKTKSGLKVLGLNMLHGFEKKNRDWRGGTIYSPQADRSYASRLKRQNDGTLQVKGCVGPICQTQTWIEVAEIDHGSPR